MLRIPLAILIILVTNFWGLVITFSDTTSPNLVHWTAYIAASHLPSALVTGALLGRRWYFGALVALIATLLLTAGLLLPSAVTLALTVTAAAYAGSRAVRAFAARSR